MTNLEQPSWQNYQERRGTIAHSAMGNLHVLPDLWSPQLGNHRHLLIYLPPSYDVSTKRYPVVYVHEGLSLFDRSSGSTGEWSIHETLQELRRAGLEAIVVGIPSSGEGCVAELTPFRDRRRGGGDGERYVAFLIETVKPLIDERYRTLPGRDSTTVVGAALGGLISLYAFFRFPAIFGRVGALSPALGFANHAILSYIRVSPPPPGKIYLDVGCRELSAQLRDRLLLRSLRYHRAVRRTYKLLLRRGYTAGHDLLYVEDRSGIHHGSTWAGRLPQALRFLLR